MIDQVGLPKSPYAFVVAASDSYRPGLIALFNSMEYHKMTADVILVPWRIPDEFLTALAQTYSFNIRFAPNSVEDQVEATAIERFRVAVELGPSYKSICLLDADMFFHTDVDLFFRVAAAGFIVTASNGMIIDFNQEYQEHYGVFLERTNWPYPLVHTTAPIFLGPNNLDWFASLYNSRRIDSWDDFLFLNLLGIKMDKYRNMICMPPYAFTGIHHWQMKPETSLIYKGQGLVLTGTEEQVYMSHGKFWDEAYRRDLLRVMYQYLARCNMGDVCKQRVEAAHRVLVTEFDKYYTYMVVGVEDNVEEVLAHE